MSSTQHQADYYGWAREQASLLAELRPSTLDWENIVEELMAAAGNKEEALESQLKRLLVHFLKFEYQPEKRTHSWEASIIGARDEIDHLLERSPSLKSYLAEALALAWRRARIEAGGEMELSKRQWERKFPAECPWSLDQVRDNDFWPGLPLADD